MVVIYFEELLFIIPLDSYYYLLLVDLQELYLPIHQ